MEGRGGEPGCVQERGRLRTPTCPRGTLCRPGGSSPPEAAAASRVHPEPAGLPRSCTSEAVNVCGSVMVRCCAAFPHPTASVSSSGAEARRLCAFHVKLPSLSFSSQKEFKAALGRGAGRGGAESRAFQSWMALKAMGRCGGAAQRVGSTHSSQCLSCPPCAAGAALQPCRVGAAASSHCPVWRPCCADGPKGPLRRQIFALCRPFRCSDFSFLLCFTVRPCSTEGPPGAVPFGCSHGPERDMFGAVQEPALCGAEHPRPSFPSSLFPSWSFLLAPSAFAPRAQQPGGPQGAVMLVGLSAPTLQGG